MGNSPLATASPSPRVISGLHAISAELVVEDLEERGEHGASRGLRQDVRNVARTGYVFEHDDEVVETLSSSRNSFFLVLPRIVAASRHAPTKMVPQVEKHRLPTVRLVEGRRKGPPGPMTPIL